MFIRHSVDTVCRAQMVSSETQSEPASSTTDSWWMVLAARLLFLIFVLFFATYLLVGDPVGEFVILLAAVVLLLYAIAFPLLSVAAVYFDRKYVSTASDWTPSLAYYAVIVPGFIAELIVLVYLHQRHKYVGTP